MFYFWRRPFFFWSLPKIGKKKCSISEEDLFFGLHLKSGRKSVLFVFFVWSSLNSTSEQSRGRGSSPPMLKIGQNWGKIANYSPQCSTKIGTTAGKDAFCLLSFSLFTWIGSTNAAKLMSVPRLDIAKLVVFYLLMIWFCFLRQNLASSAH